MSTEPTLTGTIRRHSEQLARLNLKSLALFGSAAHGTLRPESDVDVLYEFEEGEATLDHLLALKDTLEGALERHVDLVPHKYVGAVLQRYLGEVVPVYPSAD